jgi:hypothetical protein
MVRVSFIIPAENRSLHLPDPSTSSKTIFDLPSPPGLGSEITDFSTGIKYKVVNVEEVRLKTTWWLDYVAELERE